jgi:hypothetical protein
LPILAFKKCFLHFLIHMSSKWITFGVIGMGMKFPTNKEGKKKLKME